AAGLNVDEAWIGIHRIGEHPMEFHVANLALERRHIGRDRPERCVIILGASKLEKLCAVLESTIQVGQPPDDTIEQFFFFAQLLGALLIVPDFGVFELLSDDGETLRLYVEVKDTSADQQRVAAVWKECWQSNGVVPLPCAAPSALPHIITTAAASRRALGVVCSPFP